MKKRRMIMEFRLFLYKGDEPSPIQEFLFNQETVKIGRSPENDVQINDPFLLKFHVEITKEETRFQITSRSSTWTYLNNEPLMAKQPMPIKNGDSIRLPGFTVVFSTEPPQKESTPKKETPVEEKPTPDHTIDLDLEAKIVAFKMRSAYIESALLPEEERKSHLSQTLAAHLETFEDKEFGIEAILQAKIYLKEGSKDIETTSHSNRKEQSQVYDRVRQLATHLLDTNESEEHELELFLGRVENVVEQLVHFFFEYISMYRQFQHEFDVEATLIFRRDKNPVKETPSPQALLTYLLNEEGENIENVEKELNKAHQDVKMHQLAILKGFKKSLQELLREMSPAVLSEEANVGVDESSYRKIFSKFLGSDQQKIWNRYLEKYKDLSENETRTFNIIQKKFQKAYLSFLKKTDTV